MTVLSQWIDNVGVDRAVTLLAKAVNPATGLPFGKRRAARIARAVRRGPDADLDDDAPPATVKSLLAPFLKAKKPVQNPGARGGKFYQTKTGGVEYGTQGPGRQPGAAPKAPAANRGERRRQQAAASGKATANPITAPPGAKQVQAFKNAYEKVRAVALQLLQGARNFATDKKLRLMHAALTAQKTWQGFEHHVKKYGGDAEELVVHAMIELPELVSHVGEMLLSGGEAVAHHVMHAAVTHGPALAQVADMLKSGKVTWRKSHQFGLFGPKMSSGKPGPTSDHTGHAAGSKQDCPGCKEFREKQTALPLGREVQKPGSRGGHGYHDEHGKWQYGEKPKPRTGRYDIKCDDCHEKMGETDSLRESAEGGRCPKCKPKPPVLVAVMEDDPEGYAQYRIHRIENGKRTPTQEVYATNDEAQGVVDAKNHKAGISFADAVKAEQAYNRGAPAIRKTTGPHFKPAKGKP